METVKILELCRTLTISKPDFVVVGSTALYVHGVHTKHPNDLDIVVKDLEGLPGEINTYFTPSAFSFSKKRACIIAGDRPKFDIFVEDYLPDHEIIDGIRVETIPAMLFYYKKILPDVAELWKKDISIKIKSLELWQTGKI